MAPRPCTPTPLFRLKSGVWGPLIFQNVAGLVPQPPAPNPAHMRGIDINGMAPRIIQCPLRTGFKCAQRIPCFVVGVPPPEMRQPMFVRAFNARTIYSTKTFGFLAFSWSGCTNTDTAFDRIVTRVVLLLLLTTITTHTRITSLLVTITST